LKKSENLIVYNTLPWDRTGYFETTVPEYSKGDALVDEEGNTLCVQYLNNGNFCFIAKDIPANGFKKYKFIMSGKIPDKADDNFKYLTDSTTGALAGFIFKGRTWISQKEFRGLNQALYIKGQDPSDMHTSLATKISLPDNGHFIKTIETLADIEGAKQVVYTNSFYRDQNYIRLSCIIDKKAVRDKEAIHVVFPFEIENPVNRIGISDSFYIIGSGQLPGSNKDFYSVQRWLDISNEDYGVTISSPQGALFETGSITDERPLNKGVRFWKEKTEPSSTVFLYAANNYWNTNFKADQQGKVRFDVYILFHNSFNSEETRKFGEEIHMPLLPVWE
jgi:hypothetical protein